MKAKKSLGKISHIHCRLGFLCGRSIDRKKKTLSEPLTQRLEEKMETNNQEKKSTPPVGYEEERKHTSNRSINPFPRSPIFSLYTLEYQLFSSQLLVVFQYSFDWPNAMPIETSCPMPNDTLQYCSIVLRN